MFFYFLPCHYEVVLENIDAEYGGGLCFFSDVR